MKYSCYIQSLMWLFETYCSIYFQLSMENTKYKWATLFSKNNKNFSVELMGWFFKTVPRFWYKILIKDPIISQKLVKSCEKSIWLFKRSNVFVYT